MITMSAVPTRTPFPSADTNRNCRGDRAKDRGRAPARKELLQAQLLASGAKLVVEMGLSWYSRNCHYRAQSEQHK